MIGDEIYGGRLEFHPSARLYESLTLSDRANQRSVSPVLEGRKTSAHRLDLSPELAHLLAAPGEGTILVGRRGPLRYW